ncbi:hypothetical protein [Romboutsia lituseburensis]|uniref:Uncharacterized protein n=1 Tax=Romboutsia lituseburensis DSM 797 TaxID=1121325 RepID=A0A1G9KMM8_9FIRM|nr:hypothetical protein [Romboutsia lituseburensis]CEH34972.1 Hypothetical protein RLITU_2391 [Romboutsia lituseburensis]SDL50952.1 hypothetical protein SAMN04515677_102207 [Romboutsia lituseburensis DSM 797]
MEKNLNKNNKNELIKEFVNQIQGTINKKSKIQESQTTDKKMSNKRQGASIKNNLH